MTRNTPTDAAPTINQRRTRPASDGVPDVPGYRVLELVGSGGGGRVFKAVHLRLDRLVALKILHPGAAADPDALARLLAEAKAAAAIRHPGIVAVYEVGDLPTPFIAMEFCGGDLRGRLRDGPLAADEAARLALALARAVAAAHAAGVVHRDLKPANVLLIDDGSPKVADFGLARPDGGGLSLSGNVLGTPAWMSPEQAAGKNSQVGPLSDVYSLGAVLYAMLTGDGPFPGSSVEATLLRVIEHEPVPPRRFRATIPRDLETVCLKCLAKDPKARYASADALADDLTRFLGGRPILARPVGVCGRAWRFARRNPSAAGLLAACVVGPLVLAATAGFFSLELSRSNDRYREALSAVAAEERDKALGLAADGKHGEAMLRLVRSAELAPAGDIAFFDSLATEIDVLAAKAHPPEYVLASREGKRNVVHAIAENRGPDGVVHHAFAEPRDYGWLAFVADNNAFGPVGNVFAPLAARSDKGLSAAVKTATPRFFDERVPPPALRLPPSAGRPGGWNDLVRVPGPRNLLVGWSALDRAAALIDADAGTAVAEATLAGDGGATFPVVADSLVVALTSGRVALLDPRAEKPTWKVRDIPVGVNACDPAGKSLAVANVAEGAVEFRDLPTLRPGGKVRSLPNVRRLLFSPDGATLIVLRGLDPASDSCDVCRDGRRVLALTTPLVEDLRFRADGKRLLLRCASRGRDHTDTIVNLETLSADTVLTYRGDVRACLLADGRVVVPDGTSLRVFGEHREGGVFLAHHKKVVHLDTAGNKVATVDEDGVGRVFDLAATDVRRPRLVAAAAGDARADMLRRLRRDAEAFTGLRLERGVVTALKGADFEALREGTGI